MKRRLRCADDYVLALEENVRKGVHAEAELCRFLLFSLDKFPDDQDRFRRELGDKEYDMRLELARRYQALGRKEFKRVRFYELGQELVNGDHRSDPEP